MKTIRHFLSTIGIVVLVVGVSASPRSVDAKVIQADVLSESVTTKVLKPASAESDLKGGVPPTLVLGHKGDNWIDRLSGTEMTMAQAQPEFSITQVTNDQGILNYEPSISGDGTRIAFVSENEDKGFSEIWLWQSDVGSEQISFVKDWSSQPSISSDGSYVVFSSSDSPDDPRGIYLYGIEAGFQEKLITTNGGGPSINSDGTRIAFVSTLDLQKGGNIDHNEEIFLYDTATNDFTQITHTTKGYYYPPSISSDGTRIAFIWTDGLIHEPEHLNFVDLFFFDTTTKKLINITNSPGQTGPPSINSDGTRIVFASRLDLQEGSNTDHNPEIFLYYTNTNEFRQITYTTDEGYDSVNNYLPSISSDGTRIVFLSDRDLVKGYNTDLNHEVFLFDTTTNQFSQITETTPDANLGFQDAPSINSDGSVITFNSTHKGLDPKVDNSDQSLEIFVARDLNTPTKLTACGTISLPGNYLLTQDVSSPGTCFTIASSNVVLDCAYEGARYTITYGVQESGIGVTGQDVGDITIKNCHITKGSNIGGGNAGIQIYGNKGSVSILGNFIQTNGDPEGPQGNGNYGIVLKGSGSNSIISHNTIQTNGYDKNSGIYLEGTSHNKIDENDIKTYGHEYNFGATLTNSNNNSITVNYIGTNGTGCNGALMLLGSSNNTISANEIQVDGAIGGENKSIVLWQNSNSNTLTLNSVITSGAGDQSFTISIWESSENKIFNNLFNTSGGENVEADTSPNTWNTNLTPTDENIAGGPLLGGNAWDGPGGFSNPCIDKDGNRICDSPFVINANNIDYYPLVVTVKKTVTIGSLIDQFDSYYDVGAIGFTSYKGPRAKLLAAQASIIRNKYRPAINQLKAFQNQINADGRVNPVIGDVLLQNSQILIDSLSTMIK